LNATPAQVRAFAQSMGLARQPRITRDQLERSSLTIIRRNWHLLPYGQLLTLLGWTEEQLAYTLREDDFLYIKLGSLKPRCAPVRYDKPEDAPRLREIVNSEFKTQKNREPLFAFLKDLSRSSAASPPAAPGLRLCYSYFALYGDPLLDPKLDPYPDGFPWRASPRPASMPFGSRVCCKGSLRFHGNPSGAVITKRACATCSGSPSAPRSVASAYTSILTNRERCRIPSLIGAPN
jgi:hypothetical protein